MTIDKEPQSHTSSAEIEEYLLHLEPSEITKWTTGEVCSQFLERIGFHYLTENFSVNNINGKVLLMVEERNLTEMGVSVIGDRLMIMSYLKLLKKKKVEHDKMATLWQGETPYGGLEYSEDCAQCCGKIFCPCCITRKMWRITGQGIFYRIVPPMPCFSTVRQEYIDFRFLKDMELRTTNACACFCSTDELLIYAQDQKSTKEGGAAGDHEAILEAGPGFGVPHQLLHPEAKEVESIVRTAWSNARLVAE